MSFTENANQTKWRKVRLSEDEITQRRGQAAALAYQLTELEFEREEFKDKFASDLRKLEYDINRAKSDLRRIFAELRDAAGYKGIPV